MMNWHKNKFIIIGLAALILLGLALFGFGTGEREPDDSYEDESALEAQAGEIAVEGTITCLPFRVEIPEEDCVKAVKGEDGKMYALNTIKVRGIEKILPNGTKVTAIGVFEPAVRDVDESSGFTYDGVLVVRTIQPR